MRAAIAAGRLRSEDEAIREALALWERRERARAAFRAAVAEGDAEIDRAEGVDFDREELESLAREALADMHSGKTIDSDVCPVFLPVYNSCQRGCVMTEPTFERSSLERLLRPLRRELTVELAAALLRTQADEETQSRYDELADRNTEGLITPAERRELESMVRANLMLSVLKAEARAFLQHPTAA